MKFVFGFLLFIAINTFAETTITIPELSARPNTERSAPLSADTFLDPLTDSNRNRPTSWPKRLTFSPPVSMSAEEAVRTLERSRNFRVVYHCDGKPLEAKDLSNLGGMDGYVSESGQFEYSNNKITRRRYPPGQRNQQGAGREDGKCNYKLTRKENSATEFVQNHTSCTYTKWRSHTYTFVRVIETNEYVVSSLTTTYCPDGKTPIAVLLVPIPLDLVSQLILKY